MTPAMAVAALDNPDTRACVRGPCLPCAGAFDESCALHKDLRLLSDSAADLVPLLVRIDFPDDFPFAPPLVFCASPTLASEYVFDGALCMEMLVDWLPTYGNVETMIVQIAACAREHRPPNTEGEDCPVAAPRAQPRLPRRAASLACFEAPRFARVAGSPRPEQHARRRIGASRRGQQRGRDDDDGRRRERSAA